jgi:hypothetical protein
VETTVGKPSRAAHVVQDDIGIKMLRAVHFNDQLEREADEVNHIRTDRRLPAKLIAAKFLRAKEVPETFLRIGGLVGQRAGEVALVFVAVHNGWFTPSLFASRLATALRSVATGDRARLVPPRKGEGTGEN